MGTKARWISSALIVLTIVGLITLWEFNKFEQPKYISSFGDTPESMEGKEFDTIDEAVNQFAKAYSKEIGVSSYDTFYKVTDKFEQQHQIPGVMTFDFLIDNENHKMLHISPFYINEKNNKYSVMAFSGAGNAQTVKDSPKYGGFYQPIENYNYDFIVSKHKKYIPKSDVVIHLKKHKIYMGIIRYKDSFF
ncbi:hypothetical protein BHU61_09400 [Macrococcus epidermidis]|uniref:Uncharacterized protein n=1 Tax=Macrococcus epidermidis TaxID=1902580 RepID=A0A327ZQ41_9STAP|nr:hypothetical protein [Macrococcus epidermidis]RAK44359.1 hypothetical protein BHU61_09400 [Macrococcus epidermidis]